MTLITIRERPNGPDGSNATLSFDHTGEYPLTISDPFEDQQELDLEWYFEEWLRFPFMRETRAKQAAQSIHAYGEQLFKQVFADQDAYAQYAAARQQGIGTVQFEIAGSPEFHALHWETLKDPKLSLALALEAPIVRKPLKPQPVRAIVRETPTINVLVVTARPGGAHDVGYRTVSRPLVESLRQSRVPVQVEMLRPGTYQALTEHLNDVRDQHGAGYYHVIHFDLHGALMTYEQFQESLEERVSTEQVLYRGRYGRANIEAYEGYKAFLFLEGEQNGTSDAVEAGELAELLITHQIPIALLNACQSAKQIDGTAEETSLGARLMQAGVQLVLAMAYSVTVSAATLLMRTLYEQLYTGSELSAAIRRARLELFNNKTRHAYFNQEIELDDWTLPVVYQNQPVMLRPRPFTPEESAAFYTRQASSFAPPQTEYGFWGRDLDVLQIERRLLRQNNILLVRGMGGAGKTTLLRHLGWWWQQTGLVEQVFSFAYDERAWTRQQILDAIGRQLYGEVRYIATVQPLPPAAQQAMIAADLRSTCHLLILDNLESITGTQLAIRHTLPAEEQTALRQFLMSLRGGRTLVLLGSRSGEEWLAPQTFGDTVYDLPGLDQEAASQLAEAVLERHDAQRYRNDPQLAQILKLLAGYPLALEVVLSNLQRQTPAEVLAALQAGDVNLDQARDTDDKTRSIMRCIDYSHSNLSPDAQTMLLCLAPFVGVIYVPLLEQYSAQLQGQPALADLPFAQWGAVLQEAQHWGLLAPHPQIGEYLIIQPTLPYFLRSRLLAPEHAERKQAIETAFVEYYRGFGGSLYELMQAKEPQQRQTGQVLTTLEYENLRAALDLALATRGSILNIYIPLSNFLDASHDEQRGLELGQQVLQQLEAYPTETKQSALGAELAAVIDEIAKRQLLLKHYAEAEETYQQALSILQINTHYPQEAVKKVSAGVYHQLGMVAQEQRQWAQAEQYYQQALAIYVEFNARYEQACTYHQLGIVAQAQRQWAQAEQYYQQALALKVEFNARYEQAATYHQLGMVAQEQRQWAQAEQYYQQALAL